MNLQKTSVLRYSQTALLREGVSFETGVVYDYVLLKPSSQGLSRQIVSNEGGDPQEREQAPLQRNTTEPS